MRKMLTLFTSVMLITSVYAEDYNTVADFSVDNILNFAGNSNFTDFTMTEEQRKTYQREALQATQKVEVARGSYLWNSIDVQFTPSYKTGESHRFFQTTSV